MSNGMMHDAAAGSVHRRGSSIVTARGHGQGSYHVRPSSSSSSEGDWSPPDTPTPIRYLPLPRKNRLQPGRRTDFAFTVPTVKRAPATYLSYRGHDSRDLDSEGTQTDTDCDGEATETELGTALSDVESQINQPLPQHPTSDGMTGEMEGDEVDLVLLRDDVGSSPPASPRTWSDRKGKRRAREWDDELMRLGSDEDVDGDDEMETEGILGMRDKGKRPARSAKRPAGYLKEKLGPAYSIVGNICDRLGGLHASSTIIAMSVDAPLEHHSEQLDAKHPDLLAFQAASQKACIPSRRIRSRKANRTRGQKRCFQQLTASEDPLIDLPAFRQWQGISRSPARLQPETSAMDISDLEDQDLVDAEMNSLDEVDDIEMAPASAEKLRRRQRTPTPGRRSKARAMYEGRLPLAKAQLAAIDNAPALSGRYRRSRHVWPERAPGQQSTSHLHRRSPSSLLPSRRYMTLSHRPDIIPGKKARSKPGRVEVGTCLPGQNFSIALRAKMHLQRARRQKLFTYNAHDRDGRWRAMIGRWWGHALVSQMVDKWWLAPTPAGPDEVEVENLLLPIPEDQIMLSPPTSPLRLTPARKRNAEYVAAEDRVIGTEHEDRWARRNALRAVELEMYRQEIKRVRQTRKAEANRVQREVARARLAEVTELRRAQEADRQDAIRRLEAEASQRAEQVRRQEQERQVEIARRAEAEALDRARLQREQEEAARLAAVPLSPPSPAPTESSTVSDPPEYEFPFYTVVMPRSAHRLAAALSTPRARAPVLSRVRQVSDHLPAYAVDRWTNRSPPPPPPYNARTDCQTLIAPVFIEDEDSEDDGEEGLDEVDLASPLVPSRQRQASLSPALERNLDMVGAFPPQLARRLFAPTPVRPTVDPIRAFEAALDLEEGGDDEAARVDDEMFAEEEGDEEDVVPGTRVAGVFQRVFGLVWGGSGRR
ncbi:hypothetical protein IAU60_006466 [Kwoniella sp. DSM 27419]